MISFFFASVKITILTCITAFNNRRITSLTQRSRIVFSFPIISSQFPILCLFLSACVLLTLEIDEHEYIYI